MVMRKTAPPCIALCIAVAGGIDDHFSVRLASMGKKRDGKAKKPAAEPAAARPAAAP